jgi:hypothetical protein
LIKKGIVLFTGILLFCGLIYSQTEKYELAAIKINIPPVIDGILDEEVWQQAPAVSDFIQFEPDKGEPASLKTVAKILYDNKCIYIGFLCYDPEPEKIVSGMNKRDGLTVGHDVVTVSLDTFHDKRTAYYFRTNLQGVQDDGRVSDNGRVVDRIWDGNWKSAGARLEAGWSVEIAIPFRSLKYRPGKNQTWGIRMARYIPRRFEKSFWRFPQDDTFKRVSNYCTLTGLDLEASKQKGEIIPHIISRIQEDERDEIDVGLDASYAFSQFISGHLTLNPDFATVEADQEQVNLTRFELNLPEKRNFFLEGSNIYQQRIRLFYSRRIADIYGGLKLYGKVGGYEFGVLSAQTKDNSEGEESANFSVIRLKRDIMKSSFFGFMAANRLVNGKNQGTLGLDSSHYFTETIRFTGQFAMSYRGGDGQDFAFFLRPSYDSSTSHFHLRYTYLGKKFGDQTNAVGFIIDDNRHELDSAIEKILWFKNKSLERVAYKSNYNIYWGMDKTLRSWDVFQDITFDFKNKLSFRARHNQEFKLYEKKFRNHSSVVELGYNTREWESVKLSYEFGENFDSDFILLTGQIKHKITKDFSLEYGLTKLTLSPDPENQNTWIHSLRVNQYFTKDLYMTLFYQINSVIDKRNIQVVFVYRFKPPFGLIQVAYQKGTARFGEKGTQGHTLFLKLTYVF